MIEIELGPVERVSPRLISEYDLEMSLCPLHSASPAYKENGRRGRNASLGPNYARNVAARRKRERSLKYRQAILAGYKSPLALKGLAPGEQKRFRKRG